MKKVLLVLFAAAGSIFTAQAQIDIPNNGFEFWEDGGKTPANWEVISGKATRQSQVTFTVSGQQTVVKPHSGNYFLRLSTDTFRRNDTLYLNRGVMQTKFQYDLRPNFLATTMMYTPNSQSPNSQRFAIGVILMKGADTVLSGLCYTPQEATIFPFTLRYWDITGLYKTTATPDSAIVTLYSDVTNQIGFGTSLWIDNMSFNMTTPVGIEEKAEREFSLQKVAVKAYPNPMNQYAYINYSISEKANVRLVVTDITGREVANLVNESKPAGNHQVKLERNNLKAGVYIYRMQAGNKVETGKIIIAD
ncbi:MAG: T9SS type A sorting domain-containing protein [Bacteroidia bacterium]